MEKLKEIKNLKLKIVFSVLFLILMITQIGPYILFADENDMTFSFSVLTTYANNDYYEINVPVLKGYLDQNLGYCLDYQIKQPDQGSTVKFIKYLSSVNTAVLRYGYPYSTPEQLGVANEEEAIEATQYAVWYLGRSTSNPDTYKSPFVIDLDNFVPVSGYEEEFARVKAAAVRLAERALADPYYANPTFSVTKDNAVAHVNGDTILVGPYTINTNGFDVSSVDVSLTEAPSDAYLCDANGNAKSSFSTGESVYFRLSTADQNQTAKLYITAKGSYMVGKIYGTGNDNDRRQNYATVVSQPVDFSETVSISIPHLTGNIRIYKVDQYDNRLKGAEFELTDAAGNVIATKTSNDEGIVEFNDLEIGKYYVRETKGLEGYIMVTSSQEMEVNYNQTSEIKFKNTKIEGGLKIIKIDEYEKPLEGVKFQLYKADGTAYGDVVTTNADGIAYIDNLPLGSYYFKEVYVPENIVPNDKNREFEIVNMNETVEYTIKNYYKRGKLKVIKVDEDTKQRIAGVKFNVLDSNQNVVAQLVTDANGEATTGYLVNGDYTVVETENPNNSYILDTTPHSVTMAYKDQEIEVTNKKSKGSLKILKIDESKTPIAGVEFTIYDNAGNVVDVITTDENGVATSKQLELGTYKYKETNAPEYVVIDDAEYVFKLTQNDQVVVREVVNTCKRAPITIIKNDEDGNLVEGITFEILDSNKNTVDKIKTDKNGVAKSKDLLPGTYYLKEVNVPNIYIENNDLVTVEHSYNGEEVKVVNKFSKGTLKILKIDESEKPVAGVEFTIYDNAGNVVDVMTTDENGVATSKELRLGTYKYKETKAPDYVVIDDAEYVFKLTENNQVVTRSVENKLKRAPITIIKKAEDGKLLSNVTFELYTIDSDGKEVIADKFTTNSDGVAKSKDLLPGTYYLRETKAPVNIIKNTDVIKIEHVYTGTTQEVINKYAKGSLRITKIDSNDKPVAGVVFNILDNNDNILDTITTDENGIAISKELNLGTYKYQEVSAPDYVVVDENQYVFKLTENKQVAEVKVVNELAKGTLRILKVDENNKPIEKVKFEIYDENKELVDTIETDKDGIAVSKELELGKYTYKEVDAPNKYIIDDKEYDFELETKDQVVEVTVVNKEVKGFLKIVKIDDNGDIIPNVTFKIFDENKNEIAQITTDEEGIAQTELLPIGTYYYQEIDAPDNYIINDDLIKFTITPDEHDIVVTVTNQKVQGKLEIYKTDSKTKAPLKGVEFEVYDELGNVIKTLTTNDDGYAFIGDLAKGKYYFKETKALDGYIKNDTTYEFNISRDLQLVTKNITNEKQTLPVTGGFISTNMLIVIIVSVVVIAGYVIYLIITKKNAIK